MKKIIFYIYKKCWDIIANPSTEYSHHYLIKHMLDNKGKQEWVQITLNFRLDVLKYLLNTTH